MAKTPKEVSLRTLEKFGTFGDPLYITIGDPYTTKSNLDDRYKGKQFITNPSKKGKTKDVTLDKSFAPLFVGDKYVDSSSFERKARAEAKKKMISAKPWTPSNPSKRSVGLGSMYGTISPPPEHKPDPPREPQRKPAEQVGKRGFVPSSPSKKGSYGTPGTLLTHKEYEHKPDPYDKREFHKASTATPFKSMCRTGMIFDKNAVFSMDPKVLLAKPKAAVKPKERPAPPVPFKPSSPAKSGKNGALNPFPEYKPQPPSPAVKKAAPVKVFKPSSASCKSGPTRSILVSGLTGPR